ncbi:MAG TPA: hypothetical protein ENG36_03445, partial [Lentisphaerae bacterium]|nr:hypothetical protein [Lentisphaerota bacterium]
MAIGKSSQAVNSSPKGMSRWAGVILMLAIIVLLNMVASGFRIRHDFTAERLYTLSEGSRSLLGQLPRTVTLKFYFSRSNPEVPIGLKRFADRVQD